jgi:uncharacterized protein YbjT (DUF2867 family)
MEVLMILITGASGNVGKEVLKQVSEIRSDVRAAYQSLEKAAASAAVETVMVDFNQPESLRAALKGVDRVFLVGPPTAELPKLERKAVDVIKQSSVRHLVKLSAMGGREAVFPGQHADSEDYIKASGVPYTFLRPNGFMQNMVTYNAPTIQAQNAFYGTEGDGRISQIDTRDVAAVAVKALTEDGHVGKVYTVTGPEALTNSEAARILSTELGRQIRFIKLPSEQLRQSLLSAGMPEWSANALLDLQRLYRDGKAATVTTDVERVLGRKPINFAQFCHDYRSTFDTKERAASQRRGA